MLTVLKDAVECYTETPPETAGLALLVPIVRESSYDFTSVSKHVSLTYHNQDFRSATIYGMHLHDLINKQDEWDEKPAEMELIIDFSDAAMTATLTAVEFSFLEYLRILHEASIVALSLPQTFNQSVNVLAKLSNQLLPWLIETISKMYPANG
ncbi:MAG: hypothetical protein M1814_001386 [Vezdaea aestivalis]|nr:MAG: hypothetical protein M1814_001386 [Vezdaea aestivalis]